MRIKHDGIDFEAVNPRGGEGRTSDLAALQREMKWTMAEVAEMSKLEGPALALSVFLTFRIHGRMISYAKAEQLIDEVEWIVEPGDMPEPAPAEGEAAADPTSAPTASGRGDEAGGALGPLAA